VFAGHSLHVFAASALYALLYGIGLLLEIAYSFDSYGPTALRLLPLVLLWVGATTTGALLLGSKAVSRGRGYGIAFSTSIIAASAVLLFLGLCLFLPNTPVTRARFQTYSAQAAYFKAVMYGVPTAILFLVVPFLSIVRMQRELRADRHAFVLALLMREKWAVAPRGMFFARPRFLWVILLAALIVSIAASSHLLDNLLPGSFAGLFILLVQFRWILYLAFGVECVAWYSHALNELKRECVAVERLQI
jgi:membrane protein CcdC involved in cytochrome C biogenesis